MPKKSLVCFVDFLKSEYVERSLAGMREGLFSAGWDLKACEGGALTWDARMSLLYDEIRSGHHGAAAFAHFHLTDDQAALFRLAKMPLGYLGGILSGVDSATDDGNQGAFMGTNELLNQGHLRIALIMGDRQVAEARLREAGFQRAMRAKGLTPDSSLVVPLKINVADEGRKAALKLLNSPMRPTAIFCAAGDLAASGVYKAAQNLGLSIPKDLSVLGYDDLPLALTQVPPLSTLRQPLEEMGSRLATQLVAAASNPEAHETYEATVNPKLIVRQSVAAPPAA